MGENDGVGTIKSAIADLPLLTFTGRLRELLPVIEARVAAGVRHKEVVAALNQMGMTIDLETYRVILKRIRRQARARPQPSPIEPGPALSGASHEEQQSPALPVDPKAKREQISKQFIPDTPPNKFAHLIKNQETEK